MTAKRSWNRNYGPNRKASNAFLRGVKTLASGINSGKIMTDRKKKQKKKVSSYVHLFDDRPIRETIRKRRIGKVKQRHLDTKRIKMLSRNYR